MNMRMTLRRALEPHTKRLLISATLALLWGAGMPNAVMAETAAGRVEYHTSQPLGPGAIGSELRDYADAANLPPEGAVLYEGPDGMLYPGGPDTLSADCGYSCSPSWILSVDAVFLNREGDRHNSLSRFFQMEDFGYDLAGRVTLARRYDCLVGWEASYLGPFEWNQTGAFAGAGLDSILGASGVNLSAFNTAAVAQQQTYTSFLQSAEISQKWWGWDVIATSAGMRYINVEEDLLFTSTNAAAEFGALQVATNNHLIGGQIGLDLFFPVGRVSTTTKFRASAYANFMDTTTLVTNAGALQVNNADDNVDFASLLEVGYYFSYYVTPRVSVKAGYEVMWLYGLALAPDQLSNPVTINTGINADRDGDVFYHGGTAGVEITW